jgi:predicted MFS family arabinose efflux permease
LCPACKARVVRILAQTPPILALALGYFVVGTGAFVVAGLLNEISADLEVSVATAGQLIGVYSFALALGAPLLAGLIARFQRCTLIVAGLVLFGVLQWVAAVVPDYGLLAVARGLTGVAAAVVTTQSIAAAGLIAAPEQRGQALGTMFLGFSLSVVAGVPLGTVLGAALGWRVALALVGLFSIISALWIYWLLPSKMPTESIDTTSWRSLAHNRAILWIVATTVLHSAGQFTLYTYFAPVFRDSLQADAKTIGLLFGWFGACGIAGNLLMNRVTDRVGPTRAVLACLGVMAAAFVVWPLAAGSLDDVTRALALGTRRLCDSSSPADATRRACAGTRLRLCGAQLVGHVSRPGTRRCDWRCSDQRGG